MRIPPPPSPLLFAFISYSTHACKPPASLGSGELHPSHTAVLSPQRGSRLPTPLGSIGTTSPCLPARYHSSYLQGHWTRGHVPYLPTRTCHLPI